MQVAMPMQTAVVIQQQSPSWSSGWCDCFNDLNSCLLACFCPCVLFGMTYSVTNAAVWGNGVPPDETCKQNMGSCLLGGCCFVLLANLGGAFPLFCGCWNRGNLRAKLGITQGDCSSCMGDCCIWFCCPCCAMTQEWRELKIRAAQGPAVVAVPGVIMVQQQPQVQMMQQQPMYNQQTMQR